MNNRQGYAEAYKEVIHEDSLDVEGAKRGRALLERQITATDHQIDQLVYALYGLTEEEVALVEGRSL